MKNLLGFVHAHGLPESLKALEGMFSNVYCGKEGKVMVPAGDRVNTDLSVEKR